MDSDAHKRQSFRGSTHGGVSHTNLGRLGLGHDEMNWPHRRRERDQRVMDSESRIRGELERKQETSRVQRTRDRLAGGGGLGGLGIQATAGLGLRRHWRQVCKLHGLESFMAGNILVGMSGPHVCDRLSSLLFSLSSQCFLAFLLLGPIDTF